MTHRSVSGKRRLGLARLVVGLVVIASAYGIVLAVADPPTVAITGGDSEFGTVSGREGFVRFNLTNVGTKAVELEEITPTAAGLRIVEVRFPDNAPLEAGDSINVTIIAEVVDCDLISADSLIQIQAKRLTIFDRTTAEITGLLIEGVPWPSQLSGEICS